VSGLFIGLTRGYVGEFVSSLCDPCRVEAARAEGACGSRWARAAAGPAQRELGFFHLATGLRLMCLTWATMLNIADGYHLPWGSETRPCA